LITELYVAGVTGLKEEELRDRTITDRSGICQLDVSNPLK